MKTKSRSLRSIETLEPRTVLSAASLIVATPDFLDTDVDLDGVSEIAWEKGIYTDRTIDGQSTESIPFGLSLPTGYNPAAATEYPLVLYLHGKGAAENDTNKQLTRATAQFFAGNSQLYPAQNAFVLAPQTPDGEQWIDISLDPEDNGPYTQDVSSYSEYMRLTEDLLDYMTHDRNDTNLLATLGLDSDDINISQIYVVGDSMGAFGVWDIFARNPNLFAAGIAAAGSGPLNKTSELQQTPIWAIHGSADDTVPNGLQGQTASDGEIYANGAGSLGTLEWIDPTFDGTVSTALIYVDDRTSDLDNPQVTDTLVYTEFDGTFTHGDVAKDWTEDTPGVSDWLFAHTRTITPIAPGDMNGDGTVDDSDVNPFVQALTNYSDYSLAYPEIYLDAVGDVNGDGSFSFGDLGPFKTLVAASSSSSAAATASAPPSAMTPALAPEGVETPNPIQPEGIQSDVIIQPAGQMTPGLFGRSGLQFSSRIHFGRATVGRGLLVGAFGHESIRRSGFRIHPQLDQQTRNSNLSREANRDGSSLDQQAQDRERSGYNPFGGHHINGRRAARDISNDSPKSGTREAKDTDQHQESAATQDDRKVRVVHAQALAAYLGRE